MAPGRRSIAFFLLLSAAIAVAAGYGMLHLLASSNWPWRFSLPWQQMESLLESQEIAAIALDVTLNPGEGRIEGVATVGVGSPGGDGKQVILLLNRGLRVEAVGHGATALSWQREDERLVISLPEEGVEEALEITYGGALEPSNRALLVTAPDSFIADKLQWWYPHDLKSFSTFEAAVRVPEGLEVAAGGAAMESRVEDGRRVFRWREGRPVLSVGLVAGRFEKTTRVQGGVRCNIFGRGVDKAVAESWFSALGDSYNYFTTLFGADGFQQVNLVLSGAVPDIHQLGGPTIVANPAVLADQEHFFARAARAVAHNWWGDTVSGRWFTSRPEAGEWLVSGLAEYSAWQALRQVKGRRAYLRYMEQLYYPPGIPVPMKTFNLEHRLRAGESLDDALLYVRGPYVAEVIAQYIGRGAFDRACKNFLAVHRYSTVSYAALLHEMTLASEQPLEELVRVWFDRPGTFDYGISAVTAEAGRAHVTIENAGDIPAFVPLTLGIVTAESYQAQSVDPGSHGDTFSFSIDGPVERVVLDPEFTLGDMKRANNIWPPTQWPLDVEVARNGRIALLAQTAWGAGGDRQIQVFSLADKLPGYAIALGGDAGIGVQWGRDGQRLGISGGQEGVWQREAWSPGGADERFMGWFGDEPVYWQSGTIRGVGGDAPAVPLPEPQTGLAAVNADSGAVAYVTGAGMLVLWEPATGRLTPLSDEVAPAGSLNWRAATNELLFFDAEGPLLTVDAATGQVETLLQRSYAIDRSRVSGGGRYVAWVDPAGLLRAYTPNGGDARYLSLPGEVVDFAWEGEDAIIAIVATVPRRLPMRFHAQYTLWRIPTSTWTGVQLPYDPVQFAAAADTTPVFKLE